MRFMMRGSVGTLPFRAVVVVVCLGLIAGCGDNPIRHLLFPPEGYYDPLATVDVVLDGSQTTYEMAWPNPYSGTYSIGIRVTEPPPQGRPFDTSLETTLTLFVDGETVWTRDGNTTDWPFWGGREYPGGFSMMTYEVPEEIPLGQDVRCVLRVVDGDPNFHGSYGSAQWFAQKASDK